MHMRNADVICTKLYLHELHCICMYPLLKGSVSSAYVHVCREHKIKLACSYIHTCIRGAKPSGSESFRSTCKSSHRDESFVARAVQMRGSVCTVNPFRVLGAASTCRRGDRPTTAPPVNASPARLDRRRFCSAQDLVSACI